MKFLALIAPLLVMACSEIGTMPPNAVQGYAPVYVQPNLVKNVSAGSARATILAGKIYAYRNFIFQNDVNNGIHIIDNSNPAQPQKVGYISIPASTEVAVKGNFLYSNNYSDLVVFDITKPAEPRLVKRLENVFPLANQTYPPFNNTAFECADPEKGIVIRWEKKMLNQPKCRR